MCDRNDEGRCAEALRTALLASDITVGEHEMRLMARHLALVIQKNENVNLTRISTPEDGAYLHVVDSLLLLSAFSEAPVGPFVDLGTGAGFPGIPLAIATGRKALLVDSVGKKIVAVEEFLRDLGIDKRVHARQVRAEDLGRTKRGAFSVVTARAIAQTNVLVEYATPLLRRKGRLVVAKANLSDDELAAGDRAARLCGLARVSRETFELPEGRGHREVVSYERVGNPSIKLPRAVGMAKRQPLGM